MFALAAERTEGAIHCTFPLVLFNVLTPKLTNPVTEWNVPDPELDGQTDTELSRPEEVFIPTHITVSVQFVSWGPVNCILEAFILKVSSAEI